MGIYDLNQTFYLWQDIENVIDWLGELYTIDYTDGLRHYKSKTILAPEDHWVSKESNDTGYPETKRMITVGL